MEYPFVTLKELQEYMKKHKSTYSSLIFIDAENVAGYINLLSTPSVKAVVDNISTALLIITFTKDSILTFLDTLTYPADYFYVFADVKEKNAADFYITMQVASLDLIVDPKVSFVYFTEDKFALLLTTELTRVNYMVDPKYLQKVVQERQQLIPKLTSAQLRIIFKDNWKGLKPDFAKRYDLNVNDLGNWLADKVNRVKVDIAEIIRRWIVEDFIDLTV